MSNLQYKLSSICWAPVTQPQTLAPTASFLAVDANEYLRQGSVPMENDARMVFRLWLSGRLRAGPAGSGPATITIRLYDLTNAVALLTSPAVQISASVDSPIRVIADKVGPLSSLPGADARLQIQYTLTGTGATGRWYGAIYQVFRQ